MLLSPSGILEKIIEIISESNNPDHTLDHMVSFIAKSCNIDVCSVYVLDQSGKHLVLRATFGLNKTSVDHITMSLSEGLTGLALETSAPVFVKNPPAHPRFKYYAESGEEAFLTFLGLPLIYHQKAIGVMVLQTVDDITIPQKDIPFFANLATQIAATVAYTGVLEDLKRYKQQTTGVPGVFSKTPDDEDISEPKNFLKGTSVSSGFGKGHAVYFLTSIEFDQIEPRPIKNIIPEIKRLETAFKKSANDIKAVMNRAKELSLDETAILEAHLMYLSDDSFKNKIIHHIKDGFCAEFALKTEVRVHMDFFKKLDDPYLRDRALDIQDIGKRVLGTLIGYSDDSVTQFDKPTILLASDISPVDLVNLNQKNLKGIVLSKGGKASHAVILAKSFEIPIIIGVKGVLKTIKQNDYIIMDASSGIIFRNPPEEIQKEYNRLESERSHEIEKLSALKGVSAKTMDGFEVKMGANVGLISDMDLVDKYGADFIGLYRTEFPFLIRSDFPSEEEQFDLYRKIVEKANGKTVTIRTIDIGGDKFLNYLDSDIEANPFLGWRSIRISLEKEDIFREQVRAILRVSAFGNVRVLFPMITTVGEVRQILKIMKEEKKELDQEAYSYDDNIEIGIMIEVPGVIQILDRVLDDIDFVSIGTNDLIQYLLAVDRNNEKVSHLYNPLHPAVIAAIQETIAICKNKNKPACICGESAANLACVSLFIAMGADCLSMNPASIPAVKNLILNLNQKDAKSILDEVMKIDTSEEIFEYLSKKIQLKEGSPLIS